MVFEPGGRLTQYSKRDEDAPPGALVIARKAPVVEALYRACEKRRLTYVGGQLLLDGQPYTPPADRPTLSNAQITARIDGSSLPEGMKEFLRLVADLLLEHGKVDL